MKRVLVAGLCNVETSLRIEGFPLRYSPVHYPFHGVRSAVSGVGWNVAAALTALGAAVHFGDAAVVEGEHGAGGQSDRHH